MNEPADALPSRRYSRNLLPRMKAMRMLDLIEKKRDGKDLTGAEISYIVSGYTRDQISDY